MKFLIALAASMHIALADAPSSQAKDSFSYSTRAQVTMENVNKSETLADLMNFLRPLLRPSEFKKIIREINTNHVRFDSPTPPIKVQKNKITVSNGDKIYVDSLGLTLNGVVLHTKGKSSHEIFHQVLRQLRQKPGMVTSKTKNSLVIPVEAASVIVFLSFFGSAAHSLVLDSHTTIRCDVDGGFTFRYQPHRSKKQFDTIKLPEEISKAGSDSPPDQRLINELIKKCSEFPGATLSKQDTKEAITFAKIPKPISAGDFAKFAGSNLRTRQRESSSANFGSQ